VPGRYDLSGVELKESLLWETVLLAGGCSVIVPGALVLVKGIGMLQFDDAENGDCVLEFFHSES